MSPVPKNINITTVKTPYRTVNISCLQSFVIDVNVNENTYNDVNIRDNIEYTIIDEVNKYLSDNTVYSKTALLDILYIRSLRNMCVTLAFLSLLN